MTTILRSPFYSVQIRQISSSAKGHTNFFAGSPLNRLSWLRQSPIFLNAIVTSPATRWIVFNDGKPLMSTPLNSTGTSGPTLARLSTKDVRPWLGADPIFSQGQHEGTSADPEVASLQASRLHGPPIIFLGLHEDENVVQALPSSEFSAKKDAQAVVANVHGTPYFSVDVTDLEEQSVTAVLKDGSEAAGVKLEFLDGRAAMGNLTQFDSAMFAEARSLVDWSARNQYCAGCGSPVYTLWAGWKHACSSLLPWAPQTTKKPCPTGKALNNYLHPRTDPVVIILTVSPDNDKILLGRNKTWPKNFYSALAGFVEPGESLEDTVERELWEEAGIKVLGLKYHSTQPWPFPANIMAGFYAVADPSHAVRTDLDNELEDARWYTREEVLSVLNHTEGLKTGKDAPKWDSGVEEKVDDVKEVQKSQEEPPFKAPPRNAMAGVLLSDWANGKVDVRTAI